MVVVVGCSDDEIQMVHGIKQAALVDSTEQNYPDYMYNDAMRYILSAHYSLCTMKNALSNEN